MIFFDTPIVFFIFNRPELTRKVFDILRKLKPRKLIVVADGPRSNVSSDIAKCNQAKEVIETIDWNCELIKEYSSSNLGCRERISSGITNAMERNGCAIILEDDCLPHLDFFPYCEVLLKKYRGVKEVMHISGSQFMTEAMILQESYYFTRTPYIWGWATWKRAWDAYRKFDMKSFDKKSVRKMLGIGEKSFDILFDALERTVCGKIDTWDYQWHACVLRNKGLSITPKTNLVSNIGFNSQATHTTIRDSVHQHLEPMGMPFPLIHPEVLNVHPSLDKKWLEKRFYKRPFEMKIKRSIYKRIGLPWKHL